jgi:hypothetical protein
MFLVCQKLQVLWIYLKKQNYFYAILLNLLGSILLIFLQTMHMTILKLKENVVMFFSYHWLYKHKQQIFLWM